MLERRPGRVPDDPDRIDTDGDGHPDTLLVTDGIDLILLTDLDGDGDVDQLLRVGPDGDTRETPLVEPADSPALRGLITGVEAGWQ